MRFIDIMTHEEIDVLKLKGMLPDTVERHSAAESFSEWLDQRGDALADPVSFEEWLSQSEDSI